MRQLLSRREIPPLEYRRNLHRPEVFPRWLRPRERRWVGFNSPWLDDFSCAGDAEPGEVVSLKVDNHIQFGFFLNAIDKLLKVFCVDLLCLGGSFFKSFAGSLDWLGADYAVFYGDEHLRRYAYDLEIARVDIGGIWTWVVSVLPVEKVDWPGVIFTTKPLREVYLIYIAVVYVAFDFLEGPEVIILSHI